MKHFVIASLLALGFFGIPSQRASAWCNCGCGCNFSFSLTISKGGWCGCTYYFPEHPCLPNCCYSMAPAACFLGGGGGGYDCGVGYGDSGAGYNVGQGYAVAPFSTPSSTTRAPQQGANFNGLQPVGYSSYPQSGFGYGFGSGLPGFQAPSYWYGR
jgi:hypothetical protein